MARVVRRKKKKSKWGVRLMLIALAAFVAFVFVKGVQVYSQVQEKQQQLSELNDEKKKQTEINEDLKEQNKNPDAILEREANEAGLIHPDQQVYQNAAG